jgi:hypothetical protein
LVVPLLFSCSSELNPEQDPDFKCGYGGETIMEIEAEPALVKEGENNYFLRFEKGFVTESFNLNDTIYSLLPCNLDDAFQIDNLEVIVSGEIKDNPAYSSHTNYTDFYITEFTLAGT